MPNLRAAARRLGWLTAVAGVTVAVAACGSASNSALSNVIKNGLNQNAAQYKDNGFAHADSVDCPGGVKITNGAAFSCTVQGTDVKGKPASFTVSGHIVNGNQPGITSLEEVGAASTPSTPATTTT